MTRPERASVCTQGKELQPWGGLFSLIRPIPNLATYEFNLFGLLKDALRGPHFAEDELYHKGLRAPTRQRRVLRDRHAASHGKVEKLC